MNSPQSQRFVTGLALRALAGPDAALISRDVARACVAIAASLSSVIGNQGIVALYRRCVFLVSAQHPWMSGLLDCADTPMDLDALQRVLAAQSSAEAARAGAALLATFYDLLVNLVGARLTAHLLQPLLDSSSTGHAPLKDESL